MENIVLNVEGMSCSHCVNAIKGAFTENEGITNIEVSLEEKTVSVDYNKDIISLDTIKEIIEDEGYEVI